MNAAMKEIRTSEERSIAASFHLESGSLELIETCRRGSMHFTHITQLSAKEARRLFDFLAVQLHQHEVRDKLEKRP